LTRFGSLSDPFWVRSASSLPLHLDAMLAEFGELPLAEMALAWVAILSKHQWLTANRAVV